MGTYPIQIPVKSYGGKDPKLIREYRVCGQAANDIQACLNEQAR